MDPQIQVLFDTLKKLSLEFVSLLRAPSMLLSRRLPSASMITRRMEGLITGKNVEDAGELADLMADLAGATFEEKLHILSAFDIIDRLKRVTAAMHRIIQGMKANFNIASSLSKSIPPNDGIVITKIERFKPVQQVLNGISGFGMPPGFPPSRGGGSGEPDDIGELKLKLEKAKLSSEAQKVADKELKRLRMMNPAQPDYGVCRNYLETLSEIPWSVVTDDHLGRETLQRARKQLDDDHYGLEKVKKRLIEYLAVLRLKQDVNAEIDSQTVEAPSTPGSENESEPIASTDDAKIQILQSRRKADKSPILLLVGPPGTGKTSLAKSVATALGRKFHRISLGGVRDEAEIRGHRRTYIAALPGVIVNGLKKVGVANPVFLLDEIDKVGKANFQGDPSAAMLEVLDPEQNHTFNDHYVNIPIDLSRVLFIATANSLDTIPPPLLDRMETITLSGYTTLEKRYIAHRHLIPKQISNNGLRENQVHFTDLVVDSIITSYTRESGVRNLEREVGSVCRFKAVEYANARDSSPPIPYNPQVSLKDLEIILGITRFEEEIAEKSTFPGIVTGLVAYSTGGQGSILFIEVADMPGTGRVQLTGKLGDVLKESVEVALTWVKAHAFELGLTKDPATNIMRTRDVHVHCPSGAIPKDGPSAGLAHTIALVSLFRGKAVPPLVAMTGEVSLRGRVMPVGGVKEKLIGALRAGVKTVLLPVGNRNAVRDSPKEVQDGLEIVFVGYVISPVPTWASFGVDVTDCGQLLDIYGKP